MPLTKFTAADRKYFPRFIADFFEGADKFGVRFPVMDEARRNMVLIQVKRLTSLNQSVNESNLSWSEDGVYLSYESVDELERKIQLKSLAGGYERDLLVLPRGKDSFLDGIMLPSIHSYNSGLSWSRKSTRFAFMSNGGVGDYNIYVGAVGVPEKVVARSSSKDGYAAWHPSDESIAFVSSRSGGGDLYRYDFGTENLTQITNDSGTDLFPEWAHHGATLVYCSGDSVNHDIQVIDFGQKGKRNHRQLTDWAEDDVRPRVSPDGRWVAFYATDSASPAETNRRWNIHVIPLDTSKPLKAHQLVGTVVARDVVIDLNTGPAWTPDSRKIFYVKRDPERMNPIHGVDLQRRQTFIFNTETQMNRDILISSLGVLSFRAQVGAWDRVFVALTNQGIQLQTPKSPLNKIMYKTQLIDGGARHEIH